MGHALLVAVPKFEQDDSEPIPAEAFERAVDRSGLTKTQVAQLLGVGRTRVYDYLREGVVTARRVERVRQTMGLWLRDDDGNPFDGYSDRQLTEELQRRLDERH